MRLTLGANSGHIWASRSRLQLRNHTEDTIWTFPNVFSNFLGSGNVEPTPLTRLSLPVSEWKSGARKTEHELGVQDEDGDEDEDDDADMDDATDRCASCVPG